MRTDILGKTQLEAFEQKIAAKATILMQKDSVSVKLNPEYIFVEPSIECPHSLEEKLSDTDLCVSCVNKDKCIHQVEEVCSWPFSESISSHIELLNEAYAYLSKAVAEIDINAAKDGVEINALENYQNDFAFLSALLNVLSSDKGRNLMYDKYKEILSENPRWTVQDSKVNSEMLSSIESYTFRANKSVAIWNDTNQYEQYIAWVINQKDNFSAYSCNNLLELCFSILDYYASKNIHIKCCKICHEFFIPQKDYRQVYCSEECSKKFENARVHFQRKNPCFREYEKIRDRLRKRREQSFSAQTVDEIFEAENKVIELWGRLKIDMATGKITEDEAVKILSDFGNSLKKPQ